MVKDLQIDVIKKLFNELHEHVLKCEKEDYLTVFQRTELAEIALSFLKFIDVDYLEPHEKVILERDFHRVYKKIYDFESLFFFGSYYYSYRNVTSKDSDELSRQFYKLNLDTTAMMLHIISSELGMVDIGYDSTDNYFFERLERVIWSWQYLLKNQYDDLYVPMLYNISHISNTLYRYLSSGNGHYLNKARALFEEVHKFLGEFLDDKSLINRLEYNLQLKAFVELQKYRYASYKQIDYQPYLDLSYFEKCNLHSKLRILEILAEIDNTSFEQLWETMLLQLKFNQLELKEKIMLVRVFNNKNSTFDAKNKLILGLYEPFEKIDMSKLMNQTFNNYDEINPQDISDDDIKLLESFDDQGLRDRVAELIINVPKSEVYREAKKPHGVSEISDMEIRINFEGEKLFVCMPFKSGQEIKKKSVPVEVVYQIIRPFIEFNRCAVVFISAKKTSENFMNYVKKLQDKLDWPIAIVEGVQLASLLKINGML